MGPPACPGPVCSRSWTTGLGRLCADWMMVPCLWRARLWGSRALLPVWRPAVPSGTSASRQWAIFIAQGPNPVWRLAALIEATTYIAPRGKRPWPIAQALAMRAAGHSCRELLKRVHQERAQVLLGPGGPAG